MSSQADLWCIAYIVKIKPILNILVEETFYGRRSQREHIVDGQHSLDKIMLALPKFLWRCLDFKPAFSNLDAKIGKRYS